MLSFTPLSSLPLSTTSITVSTVIEQLDIPVEIVGVKTDARVKTWVLSSRGKQWVLSNRQKEWILSSRTKQWVLSNVQTQWILDSRTSKWIIK